MNKFKHKVSIAGKEYVCEVIDGVRYIDGVTVSEFYSRLSPMEIAELARVGAAALDAERRRQSFFPSTMYREIRHLKN